MKVDSSLIGAEACGTSITTTMGPEMPDNPVTEMRWALVPKVR
jgi:hypothetical protein